MTQSVDEVWYKDLILVPGVTGIVLKDPRLSPGLAGILIISKTS